VLHSGAAPSAEELMKHELLERGKQHVFSTGLPDSGTKLCKANMKYGLAKIHCVQEHLGLEPNAFFFGTPDMTITRNVNRWANGFGYGGKLCWGDGTQELIILDAKPNGCGMLVGGLDRLPPARDLIERIQKLKEERITIDGVEIHWDFGKSNHFIDVFRVQPMTDDVDLPEFAFITHYAGDELRGDAQGTFGLYYDYSPRLMQMAEVLETPFGPCRYLTGRAATEYLERFRYVEQFSKQRRLLAAERLFGDFQLLGNETHQGLLNYNELLLGCHPVTEDRNVLYPLVLRSDLPAYLIRGKPNLTPEQVEILGFRERAERLGVYESLLTANVVPHGGGYVFDHMLDVLQVHEIHGTRYFEMDAYHDYGRKILQNVREIPYSYRGREVALRTFELELAEPVAKLTPVYVMKV